MIDFNKLNSQFDMNNLDANQITKILGEHQNSLVKIVVVIATLIAGGIMFNDHHSKDLDLHARITQLQDKLAAVKARDAAVLGLKTFKSSIPKKISEFELITMISNYSKPFNVTITSLSPAESRDKGLYDVINVNFEAVSDNFKDMMLFFRKIEKGDFPLRIDSWTGQETSDGRMTFQITISAVLIHP